MQWGGPLSLFDATTSTQVTVRTFGAFEGTIAHPNGEAILQPMLLEAVRAAAAQHGGSVFDLANEKDAIAAAAQAELAPRLHELGAVGQLSIAAFTLPPEEHERLTKLGVEAALAKRAASAAAAAPPTQAAACAKCGAPEPARFCRACGTPSGSAGVPHAAAPAAPFAVGAAVRVQWSDGQHYPGAVQECRADQVLVGFPNGSTQWVPIQFVSPG